MGSDVARPEHGVFRPVHEGMHVRVLGDEAVVHVAATDEWHVLDARGVAVLDAVDGRRDSAAVATATGLTVDETCVILAELATQGVLLPPAGVTRRSLLQRAALVGGVAAGASVLGSVAAPLVAAAGSPTSGRVSLRSTTAGQENLYVTRSATSDQAFMTAQVPVSGPQTDRDRATFELVPGLKGGSTVSFKAIDLTDAYLRHAGEVIYVNGGSGEPFVSDASYFYEAGLSGTGSSFRASTAGYTTYYLFRFGGAGQGLGIAVPNGTDAFKQNASFYVTDPLSPLVTP